MAEPTVLILGGGIGGVVAARELRKRLDSKARVVVIDKEARASFPPSYLWVVTGERRPEAISRQRSRLARAGIEFVNAEVNAIDPAGKHVRAGSREFHYDYLVVALGAETSLDGIPGLAESAQSFYTLDGAERLGASLRYFAGGRIAIVVTSLPLKFPAAPYEAAMLLEHLFHQRRLRQKVEIGIYTPEPEPLPIAGPENSEALLGLLAHKGIEFHPGHQLIKVKSQERSLVFEEGKSSETFQLLIATPEHRAPAIAIEAGLTDDSGWVRVHNTMETVHDDIFAIGDITRIPLTDGLEVPKESALAEAMARVAASQIAYRITGKRHPQTFHALGRSYLEVGSGAATVFDGDFLSPQRQIEMKQPSIVWHLAKVAAERQWLWRTY